MRLDHDESAVLINMDPKLRVLVQRRRQFLVTTDSMGRAVDERTIGDRKQGMFHPITQWDIAPPIRDRRQRVWKEGRSQAISLVYASPQLRTMPHTLPEDVWAAAIGGRVVVTPQTQAGHRIVERQVVNGELDHAVILGTESEPITIRRCDMENCLFYNCHFAYVRFESCNFLKSNFAQCFFDSCIFNDCSFQRTRWGDDAYLKNPRAMLNDEDAPTGDPALYNRIYDCTLQGKRDFAGSRGYGPAPWFEADENEALEEAVIAVYQARQRNLDPREDKAARLSVWTAPKGQER